MKKIDKLTPEQEAYLPVFYEGALAVGMCTDPTDFDRAKEAICNIYTHMGKDLPYVWLASGPYEAQMIINLWQKFPLNVLLKELENNKDGSVLERLQSKIDSLDEITYHETYLWGSFENYWIAYYKFCEYIGVKYSKQDAMILNWWDDLARSTSAWWPFEHGVVVCDRPKAINTMLNRANTHILHCEDGPAMAFRDGYEIYALEGVVVPKEVVVSPELITEEQIWAEENNEVRRIMIQKYGADRLLESAECIDRDFQIIDEDQENFPPIPRALFLLKDESKWMYCTDGGTERCYVLPMPDWVNTCKEGYFSITGREEHLVKGRS